MDRPNYFPVCLVWLRAYKQFCLACWSEFHSKKLALRKYSPFLDRSKIKKRHLSALSCFRLDVHARSTALFMLTGGSLYSNGAQF